MTNWYGLLVPSATRKDIVARLQQEVARIMALPDVRQSMVAGGMTIVANTPDQFAVFLVQEMDKYARVIRTAGVKPE